jgi:phosphate-selective porin
MSYRPASCAGLLALALATVAGAASHAEAATADSAAKSVVLVGHGSRGFEMRSLDGDFLLQTQLRGQFRYATPGEATALTITSVNQSTRHDLVVQRARLKMGGHTYKPWFKYYFEYEVSNGNLLDLRFMVERYEWLKLKVGQGKVQYNRERAISSGKQQLMDRSIINSPFTLDRQQGVSLYGRLRNGGVADVNYWVSVWSGAGQQMKGNDDAHPMVMGRLQWNPLGRVVTKYGSDLDGTRDAAVLLAVAAATNRSQYTRFSQSGGGQLPGFSTGVPGQYRVNQWMQETGLKYRGLGWQQEYHRKEIHDLLNRELTTLAGYFVQLGYFAHHAWRAVPPQLELAIRYAHYDPNVATSADEEEEWAVTVNWFLREHLNKVSAEVTHVTVREPPATKDGWLRFRLQWEVSI